MLRLLEHRGQVQAQLTLHPAELGGVEVRLRQTAHGLMATVTADRAEAAHVLQQAGTELRRALEAQGVQVAGLDIGMAGENQDAANARANERRAESAPAADRAAVGERPTTSFPPSTPTTAPRPRRRSPSGPSSTCSRRSTPMSTVNPLSLPAAPQSTTATTSNQDAFGKDAFMKLLVEQMRHQSPTDPSDGQAWINQMTQFSMLEQMQQQSAGQVKANAAGYLGKTVSWQDAKGQSGQGVVEKVDFTGNEPTLTVAGHAGVKVGEVQRRRMTPLSHNPALVPPVGAPAPVAPATAPRTGGATAPNGPSFADVLGEKSGAVQLSGHAKARIERRGIQLDPATLSRLQNGVDRAAAKGSRESVVLVDDVAFVVSVKARTVITAVDRASMRDHVFTNIDSAVLS